jgi:hypothetical protein
MFCHLSRFVLSQLSDQHSCTALKRFWNQIFAWILGLVLSKPWCDVKDLQETLEMTVTARQVSCIDTESMC